MKEDVHADTAGVNCNNFAEIVDNYRPKRIIDSHYKTVQGGARVVTPQTSQGDSK